MKTFREFILEAIPHPIPEKDRKEWEQERSSGKGPVRKTFGGVEYEMRNKAGKDKPKKWGISTVSSRKASIEKRSKAEQETELTQDELRKSSNGDEERSALAYDTEQSGIKKVKSRGKRIEKATGVRQSLGHKQPLQPENPSPEDPGHTLSNITVEPYSPNVAKGNKRPGPEEPGYGLTRAQATQDALRRGGRLGAKIDRELELIRSGKESRAARLLAKLRRPRSKNSPERTKEQEARMAAAYDKRVDDTVNS